MKSLFIMFFLFLSLSAQESYTQGKIDMHGGKDTYGSFSTRNYGNFSTSPMNMSQFLDKNLSKNSPQTKVKK